MSVLLNGVQGVGPGADQILSDPFVVPGPGAPVSLDSARLGLTEKIQVLKLSEATGEYEPYRQGGTVELTYNDTGCMIFSQGTYRLALAMKTAGLVYAEYQTYGS